MWVQNANSICTRGIPFGATPVSTCGMVYYVRIVETPVERHGGQYKKIKSSILQTYKPFRKPPKLITISVYAYGLIFSETVMVDDATNLTVDNVKLVEGEDGKLKVEVVGVELL